MAWAGARLGVQPEEQSFLTFDAQSRASYARPDEGVRAYMICSQRITWIRTPTFRFFHDRSAV
jgi:hypothetical protein